MACVNPQPYLVPYAGGSPRHLVATDWPAGDYLGTGRVVYLPCGNCLQCLIARRKDLTSLQCLEASLHDYNWFLTLTYDDEYLPRFGSLVKSHLADFCQSMRKHFLYLGCSFRYLASGEYGEHTRRPHYHLSCFGLSPDRLGLDFKDVDNVRLDGLLNYGEFSSVYSSSRDSNGEFSWVSPVVSQFWRFGSHKLFLANKDTFQYVAGYVTKKLTSPYVPGGNLVKEFRVQSRPSIGRPWFDKHKRKLVQICDERIYHDSVSGDFGDWRIPRIMYKWLCNERGEAFKRSVSFLHSLEFGEPLPDRVRLGRVKEHDRLVALRFSVNKKGTSKL